ncbi:MAG TPA: arginine deiminase family protein [Thermomicrobiales bacterium]|nr:arginine deiminase family protein [Thermomicrobiales bacterium]
MTASAGVGTRTCGGQSAVAPLRRVLLYPPVAPDAGVSWEAFAYQHPIDAALAEREHAALRRLLAGSGVEIVAGEIGDPALQDAIFGFDPVIITDAGAILCRMGKPLREAEVALMERTLGALGVPIAGRIVAPGTVEGGDCLWLDRQTLAVGRGYRTNAEGIRQLRAILAAQGVEVVTVDLPHWHGPGECLHLLSLISMVDERLAVVYPPLLSVAFVEELTARGVELVPIPGEEFPTQGCNVLALAPRRCLLLRENVVTAQRLRDAGCEVLTYAGDEISHNRAGGPTCLTQPLLRA